MPKSVTLMAALVLAATALSSAGAYAAQRPDPQPAPDPLAQAVLSDADLAQFKAHEVLSKTALPAGVQFQHLKINDDQSITAVVTAGSAKAKSAPTAATIQQKLKSAGVGLAVKVEVTKIADQQLDEVADQAFTTLDQWAGDLAPLVNRIGPDHTGGSVVIGMSSDSAALKARAKAHFDVPLRFDLSQTAKSTIGRYDDSAPWTAGNALTNDPARAGQPPANCTQGFSWRMPDGIKYGSTAGHCWGIGTSVFHATPEQRMGYISSRWFSDGGPTDFELILPRSGSFDSTVWLGATSTIDYRYVVGADNVNSDVNEGKTVCFSGANGGTNCGPMTLFHQIIRFTNHSTGQKYWTKGLTCVTLASTATLQGGDSGGPVLSTYKDGTAFAWGQTVGQILDSNGNPNPTAPCGGIFTPVKVISATIGGTMVVGDAPPCTICKTSAAPELGFRGRELTVG